ncbi:glycoside hydrolase family 3 N-terminal domain-containing protein [Streptomyces sp. NEAU-H3]|uniref:glycoside hydrolase family 3 N-terminal domain-containing protein n=1 Tax=Streptomyces sp. NEAU-H3 TaxID=2720636 RepID=UPI0014388B70|nr:glycoside hydrolase family 3 N-terminal domain-containing protein [Streptomyces sp. NEAU-H3]NJA57888.1 glycosyl hydrolase [Streptomyces sp. NEAU-H3]
MTVEHTADDHLELVRDLLSRMTVAEKLGQLQQLSWNSATGPGGGETEEIENAAREGRLGSVLNITGATHTNALQRLAVEESRLGIPLIFGLDVIHGYWTTFPIPLAQAASWDPAVAERDGEVSAEEARSAGVHWTFNPMMDVCHEPRWGRIAESAGEDPYLTAVLTAAKVRGYQGPALSADPRKVAACAKHFAADGGAEGGRDYNTVDVSEQRLRNVYLPPFKAALDAGVATVMASFNTVSGVPAHANSHLLTEVLRQEWKYDGMVVSDWTGVQELIAHGLAEDGADALRQALGAGVDMEMVSTHITEHGEKLLAAGAIDPARLDEAVSRVLLLKARLGLFTAPYAEESAEITEPGAEARRATRETAARTLVLLKNETAANGASVLPLPATAASVAVVGPFALSTDLHGTWAGPGAARFAATTVLEGLREALPATEVLYAEGEAEAIAAVREADVTVVAVGEPSEISGEASTRADISLPEGQAELIRQVASVGKPFAVVVFGGRPLTMEEWIDEAPAVLFAWHPGLEGGHAVADVLTGKVNPSAKLPVTFPRSAGQIPLYYNHENTGRPADPADPKVPFRSFYLDVEHGPRFAFGHGLSYTRFETGAPVLSRTEISLRELGEGGSVEVTVPVRNAGDVAGTEVVQVYVHARAASIVQPVRRLRGFARVELAPGQSEEVVVRLDSEDLGFWDNDPAGNYRVETGAFDIYAGTDSTATAHTTLHVV